MGIWNADDFNTVDHLPARGIHDRPLENLRQQVLARAVKSRS
jgi:hypothetical protein